MGAAQYLLATPRAGKHSPKRGTPRGSTPELAKSLTGKPMLTPPREATTKSNGPDEEMATLLTVTTTTTYDYTPVYGAFCSNSFLAVEVRLAAKEMTNMSDTCQGCKFSYFHTKQTADFEFDDRDCLNQANQGCSAYEAE